jgi:phosphoribosyl 1,2-cyclic phosphate phosphodiesterase
MNIEEACAVAAEIAAPVTYLTHLTHNIEHAVWEEKLPAGVHLAYDGLRLRLG